MIGRRWLILAILAVSRVAMGFQYQTIGSSAPGLNHDLGIGFAEIGTLIGLYHIAGVFLSLPGGLIIQRLGDKRLCAIGLAMMAGGGAIVAAAHGYGIAFTGRLISGIGGILFNLVITKMTADWFARREIVVAMAVILSTWPLGLALGLFVQPPVLAAFGWRAVMGVSAALCVASLLLVSAFYRVPEDIPAATAGPFRLPPGPVLAPVIAAGLVWGTFNAGLVGYFSFVPPLLASRGGMTLTQAGALTSTALWIGMLSIPFGGTVAQWLRQPAATIVLFCAILSGSLAAVVAGAPPLAACIVFGLALGPPPGVITSLPTRILAPADRAAGLGVFYTFHSLFQASGPAVIGWVQDRAGGDAAVGFTAILFLLPVPLLGVFALLARRLERAA